MDMVRCGSFGRLRAGSGQAHDERAGELPGCAQPGPPAGFSVESWLFPSAVMRIDGTGCRSRLRSIDWPSVSPGKRTCWPCFNAAASPEIRNGSRRCGSTSGRRLRTQSGNRSTQTQRPAAIWPGVSIASPPSTAWDSPVTKLETIRTHGLWVIGCRQGVVGGYEPSGPRSRHKILAG